VLVQIEIKKDSANGWKSLGSSVLAVPIEVYDY
jgi:hypothetical protein